MAVAVESSLMGVEPYAPGMEYSEYSLKRRAEWKALKNKLLALQQRHGLKTRKWKLE